MQDEDIPTEKWDVIMSICHFVHVLSVSFDGLFLSKL